MWCFEEIQNNLSKMGTELSPVPLDFQPHFFKLFDNYARGLFYLCLFEMHEKNEKQIGFDNIVSIINESYNFFKNSFNSFVDN